MRRSRKEITDKQEIEDILNRAEVARLGINTPEGAPYVVPLNFGYSEEVFYFHCAGEGYKLELLKNNPEVCIEIDENMGLAGKEDNSNPCSWGMNYRSVIAFGKAEFLTERADKLNALKLVVAKFAAPGDFPFPAEAADSVTVFRVKIETLSAKSSNSLRA